MSLLTSPADDPAAVAGCATRSRTGPAALPRLYLSLAKARLSALVVLTAVVGYVMAAPAIDWLVLLATMAGTALSAGGANALNQIVERRRDALMHRTQDRPLPSGAMAPPHALVFAMAATYAGLLLLGLVAGLAAAGLAGLTVLLYVAVYTPLKPLTTVNTLAGALCGAIPPLIGWVAGAGRLDPGAWMLGTLLFVWQLPHFLALAWLYRADYARGGFVMLPVLDRGGRLTGQVVVLTSMMLVPVSLGAVLLGLAGWVYAVGAVVLGAGMVAVAAFLYRDRSEASARRVFLASITYLPLLLALMVADRGAVLSAAATPSATIAAAP